MSPEACIVTKPNPYMGTEGFTPLRGTEKDHPTPSGRGKIRDPFTDMKNLNSEKSIELDAKFKFF